MPSLHRLSISVAREEVWFKFEKCSKKFGGLRIYKLESNDDYDDDLDLDDPDEPIMDGSDDEFSDLEGDDLDDPGPDPSLTAGFLGPSDTPGPSDSPGQPPPSPGRLLVERSSPQVHSCG